MESGSQKNLFLSQTEILNLSVAMSNKSKDLQCFTFWYDGSDTKLSGVLNLNKVEFVEVDDKELGLRELELVDYRKFRIWREPSFLRKLYFKVKWYFEDKKEKKGSKK